MRGELLSLEKQLSAALSVRPAQWGHPDDPMRKVLDKIQKEYDNPVPLILSDNRVLKALLAFRKTRELRTFQDIKYVCFGVAVEHTKWRLVHDTELFERLLSKVEPFITAPRQFRRCYQGLLHGYFGYPVFDDHIPNEEKKNWRRLREFLHDHIQLLVQNDASFQPKWVPIISEHVNLLSEKQKFDRYSHNILNGDSTEFNGVCKELGVPPESWVWEAAIDAQIQTACKALDSEYKNHLDRLLSLLMEGGVRSDILRKKCLAKLLIRYSQCKERPKHGVLRDLAIAWIGNPWLNKTAWDAHVKNDNAWQMIYGWLKEQLIRDFFSLLSEDKLADERRLNYWLRFESSIEGMWFALGNTVINSKDYYEFQERASGLTLALENGGPPDNNAFIMKMGDCTVVEFSKKGNACFLYKSGNLPFRLEPGRAVKGDTSGLKRNQDDKMLHMDGKNKWEDKFDEKLKPLIGEGAYSQSDTASAFNMQNLARFISRKGYSSSTIRDSRDIGGALWVEVTGADPETKRVFEKWGFKYKLGRGWWKE